ncbi:MAG TPA: universal stress protein [Caldilineaceae bacterium]|nr:universal stress protein [Caldilineaceae bacterium]
MDTELLGKILIPLDGSSLAERAMAHIQHMTSPAKSEIVLAGVIDPARYSLGALDFMNPNLATLIRTSTQEYLAGQRTVLQKAGFQVSTQVVDGDPAQQILALTKSTGATLIAMSTHGSSGFVRWALGSVAERVIHGATTPIFLVRESTAVRSGPPQRILAPLDGSALAEQVLPQAQALATETGASVLLLQVIQALDERSRRLFFQNEAVAEETFARWQSDAEFYLQEVAQRLQAAGLAVEVRALVGDPDSSIIETAETEQIDLIVMSTHGRSGLSRWYYGSVANKVLHSAGCPLLLVRSSDLAESDE